MAFDEAVHPRGEAGSAQGGEFVAASSSTKAKKPAAKTRKAALKRGGRGGGGTLSFNGKTGTGYGKAGGDPRVKALQQALTRLGLTDSRGRKLAADGQLGPLTTQAVKAAQRKLGVKPDGKVTPALLKQLTAAKSLGKPKPSSGTHKRSALTRKKRALKTSASGKPAAKAKPKPRPKPPPAVQRAIARIPANQRK